MICRLTGRVEEVTENAVRLVVGAVCYEVWVPLSAIEALRGFHGQEVSLHTLQYLEGNPTGGNFVPRLIGFLTGADREFFSALVKVRGISARKALRAMSIPAHQFARAVADENVAALAALPEIGKRTATQLIADLGSKIDRFLAAESPAIPVRELSSAQRVAVDILVQWGDRRADASRWVAAAVEADASLVRPEDIVRAAYREKTRV